MPETWAASGARLPLHLDLRFEEPSMDQSNNVEDEPILTPFKTPDADATPPLAAKPLAPVSFVGMEGEQHVALLPSP